MRQRFRVAAAIVGSAAMIADFTGIALETKAMLEFPAALPKAKLVTVRGAAVAPSARKESTHQ